MKAFPMMIVRSFHAELRAACSIAAIESPTQFHELQAISAVSRFVQDNFGHTDTFLREDLHFCDSSLDYLFRNSPEAFAGATYPFRPAVTAIMESMQPLRAEFETKNDSLEHAQQLFGIARGVIAACLQLADQQPEYYSKVKYMIFSSLCNNLLPGRVPNPLFARYEYRDVATNLLISLLLINSSAFDQPRNIR